MEIDAASNTGVDNVREVIINSISIAPARDRHKIFIIDEVHMLSTAAFNALLKTLEEPPPRVVFILATTELQKVPETILSRCQVFEFRTITLRKITEQLRAIAAVEGVQISEAALLAIARAGEGSMRDAESAFDQVISFSGLEIKDEDVSAALGLVDLETLNNTLRAVADQDAGQVLRIIDEVVTRGYDLRTFCRELIVHIRALLVVKVAGFDAELVQMPSSEGESLARLADAFSEQDLVRFFSILSKTEQDIRTTSQPRFHLEIGLMKLVYSRRLYQLEDALRQLEEIRAVLGAGGMITASDAGTPRQQSSPLARASEKKAPPPAAPKSRSFQPAAQSYVPPPIEEEPEIERSNRAPNRPAAIEASATAASGPATGGEDAVKKIIAALEAKRRMMLVTVLDKAQVRIDGDFLRVTLLPENARDKSQIEPKDKRQLIEETAREIVGRRLQLSVSIGAESSGEPEQPAQKPKANPKRLAEENPKLRALTDKFHGEIIEVVKPEQ
jgi:DNA polymerase-3 subunit gamma/tau